MKQLSLAELRMRAETVMRENNFVVENPTAVEAELQARKTVRTKLCARSRAGVHTHLPREIPADTVFGREPDPKGRTRGGCSSATDAGIRPQECALADLLAGADTEVVQQRQGGKILL